MWVLSLSISQYDSTCFKHVDCRVICLLNFDVKIVKFYFLFKIIVRAKELLFFSLFLFVLLKNKFIKIYWLWNSELLKLWILKKIDWANPLSMKWKESTDGANQITTRESDLCKKRNHSSPSFVKNDNLKKDSYYYWGLLNKLV